MIRESYQLGPGFIFGSLIIVHPVVDHHLGLHEGSGMSNLREAKITLATQFDLVGITERMNEGPKPRNPKS